MSKKLVLFYSYGSNPPRLLKGEATRRLVEVDRRPMEPYRSEDGRLPSMSSEGQWKVFLDTEEAIDNAIRYVENNPEREGKPRQHWSFVTPFPGLPKGG